MKHDICKGERAPVMTDDHESAAERGKGAARHGHVTVWAARASRSAAILDLDGDGDLDIVTNNYGDVPQMFISDLAQRGPVHFLTVRLVGTAVEPRRHRRGRDRARRGPGAASGERRKVRLPRAERDAALFRPGTATQADSITVKWPTGKEQIVRGPLRSGSTVVVKEQ